MKKYHDRRNRYKTTTESIYLQFLNFVFYFNYTTFKDWKYLTLLHT